MITKDISVVCKLFWSASLKTDCMCKIVNYCIVPCTHPSLSKGPLPNFDSSVVCEVLHVTTHHANSCVVTQKLTVWAHVDCFDEFQVLLHPAARVPTPVIASSAVFFACSTKFAYCKRQMLWSRWQRDCSRLACFLAGYSFLYCHAGLVCLKKEAWVKLRRKSIQ